MLKAIADTICRAKDQCERLGPARQAIAFVGAGEKPQAAAGLIGTVHNFQMRVDLGKPLQFPEDITETRHSAGFGKIKAGGHAEAYNALGEEDGGIKPSMQIWW